MQQLPLPSHHLTQEGANILPTPEEERQHKAIHKKLVDQVLDYQKKLIAGDPTVSINLMTFLKDWLTSHIKGIDTKYVHFMKEHGIN